MTEKLTIHQQLIRKMTCLKSDYEPYGKREREGGDCSCGCVHYSVLEGKLGADWGVCINPESPRFALLTFEHQGCPNFECERQRKRSKRGKK